MADLYATTATRRSSGYPLFCLIDTSHTSVRERHACDRIQAEKDGRAHPVRALRLAGFEPSSHNSASHVCSRQSARNRIRTTIRRARLASLGEVSCRSPCKTLFMMLAASNILVLGSTLWLLVGGLHGTVERGV